MINFLKRLSKILVFLFLLFAWLWGAMAIFLAGPEPHWLSIILTIVFVAFMPLAFVVSRSFVKGVAFCVGGFLLLLLWWQTLTPTNTKDWAPDVAQIAHGEIEGDRLTMYNVRNFDYSSEQKYSERWETRNYDLKNLQGLDIFLSYWASDDIAHTILSWDFGEGEHLAISIETRKDKTQEYSAVKGFFKQFEISYIAADERDIIKLRTNYRKERVYLYRLLVPKEQVLALFKNYLQEMNSLVDKPEFYGALAHNCTTTIQLHANAINPDAPPPLDWRLIATGHVDELLYDRGVLRHDIPFSELRQKSRVDLEMQSYGGLDYSSALREALIE